MSAAVYQQAQRIIRLLRDDPRRDVYEGAGPDGQGGSGNYWVTYGPNASFNREVLEFLLTEGWLVEDKDCEFLFRRGPRLTP